MSVFRGEDHRFKEEFIHPDDKELASIGRECRLSDRTVSPRSHMEQEKRMRREIANSNERRRMQSINAGFQSLRTLLPSHEGEKLSKAAILQQTAEYIYVLEQEKTRLLSQNCQLKRLVNQHEGEVSAATANLSKKRKLESAPTTTTTSVVCESADEGIGSMSPEPVSANTVGMEGDGTVEHLRRDLVDLRLQLERERRLRMLVEEKLRGMESQASQGSQPVQGVQTVQTVYSTADRLQHVQLSYQQHQPHDSLQVMEHTPHSHQTVIEESVIEEMEVPLPLMPDEQDQQGEDALMNQLLSSAVLPPVIQTQTVSTSPDPDEGNCVKKEPSDDGSCSEPGSPRSTLVLRIPSVIEAAMKADPKVEVERLPPVVGEDTPPSSTSRQNLETIVEAIRHLEGDHLFNDIPSPPGHHRLQPVQDVPLALTTKHQTPQRLIKVDMNPYLQFHTTQSLQQQRPGVIVVKHT